MEKRGVKLWQYKLYSFNRGEKMNKVKIVNVFLLRFVRNM